MRYYLDVESDLVALGHEPVYDWDHFPRMDEIRGVSCEILATVKVDEDFREAYLRPCQFALNRALASPDLKSDQEPYVGWTVSDPHFLLAEKKEPVYFAIWVKQ